MLVTLILTARGDNQWMWGRGYELWQLCKIWNRLHNVALLHKLCSISGVRCIEMRCIVQVVWVAILATLEWCDTARGAEWVSWWNYTLWFLSRAWDDSNEDTVEKSYLMFPSRILSYSQRGISPRLCLYLKFNEQVMSKLNFLQHGFIQEKGKVLSNGGLDLTHPLFCNVDQYFDPEARQCHLFSPSKR